MIYDKKASDLVRRKSDNPSIIIGSMFDAVDVLLEQSMDA
jgi:hypothetical protein